MSRRLWFPVPVALLVAVLVGPTGVTAVEPRVTTTSIMIPAAAFIPNTDDYDYANLPNYRPSGILDNTTFGGNQTALPNLWTLPGRNNPWVGY